MVLWLPLYTGFTVREHSSIVFRAHEDTMFKEIILHSTCSRALCEIMTGVISRSPPTVTHVIPGENGVTAVTSLDDHVCDVYAVRQHRKEVEVYDAVALTLESRLPIPGLRFSANGIAACSRNKCLYLSDHNNHNIHRVDLATDAMKSWPVAAGPRGLSVNRDHNVMVACQTGKKLQEYTTDGRLVREICVPAGLGGPWHAIQLSTGDYVVSHFETRGVVSVLGVDGQLLRSYGPSSPSDIGPMRLPTSLAVTKHGDILVADSDQHRILAINCRLTRAQVFSLPADVGLQRPFALYLDDTRDRLYIGEGTGKNRVIVLNICW